MNELTVTRIIGWCCVEPTVPGGQPSIMLQVELHDGNKATLLLRETEIASLGNISSTAWIDFTAWRMGMPRKDRWARVEHKGDQIQVIPPGHQESN